MSTPGWFSYSYVEACASTRDWERWQEGRSLGQRSCGTCARHGWGASSCPDLGQPDLLHSAAPPGNLLSVDVEQKGSAARSLLRADPWVLPGWRQAGACSWSPSAPKGLPAALSMALGRDSYAVNWQHSALLPGRQ